MLACETLCVLHVRSNATYWITNQCTMHMGLLWTHPHEGLLACTKANAKAVHVPTRPGLDLMRCTYAIAYLRTHPDEYVHLYYAMAGLYQSCTVLTTATARPFFQGACSRLSGQPVNPPWLPILGHKSPSPPIFRFLCFNSKI